MVMRVKASPALEPNGLEPPTPPNAPARPPPLPRWISTRPIRNRPSRITSRLMKFASIGSLPASGEQESRTDQLRSIVSFAVNGKYTQLWDSEQANSRRGGLHDREERIGLQTGAAHERPVHVRLAHQDRGVVRFDAA